MRNVEWLGSPPKASRRVDWLGAPPVGVGVIPVECWDMPGFKDCHARQWERARSTCDPAFGGRADFMGYGTVGACINAMANEFAEIECVPQFCATGTRVPSGMVYGESTFNPITAAEQKSINASITQKGFQPIDEDGRLGPKTCGAASVSEVGIVSACFGHEGEWVRPPCVAGKTFDEQTETCVEATAPPPPTPGACPPGQRRDVTSGECRPISCPSGQQLDPVTGKCISPPPTPTAGKRKKKDNTGILLLGVAALAAGAFALI